MDLSEYLLKIDHFDKMHVLKDEGKIEGAPNFRQVSFGSYWIDFPKIRQYQEQVDWNIIKQFKFLIL